MQGKELRLKQEYFLVAATLADIIRRYKHTKLGVSATTRDDFSTFPDKVKMQFHQSIGEIFVFRLPFNLMIHIQH